MTKLMSLFAAAGLGLGCATPTSELEHEILTTGDTDVAAECAGILEYANQASFATLDAFLPVDVASAIVARRTLSPFVSIADLSSVTGVAQARLELIEDHARGDDFIDEDCAGVYEELAVSADDRGAILTFVNTASTARLTAALRFRPDVVGPQLVAARPFTTLQQLVDMYGIGPASFRAIRDAAIVGPFDILVAAVNALHNEVEIRTDFDPYAALFGEGTSGQLGGLTCFGMDPDAVTQASGTIRPNLADGPEVNTAVTNAVNYANRYNTLPIAPAPGLADLAAQTANQTFYGCYGQYVPNPWCGFSLAFFVNTQTGYRVRIDSGWCE